MATLSLTSWVLTLYLGEPNSQGHLRFSKRGDPGNETVCLVTVKLTVLVFAFLLVTLG